MVAQSEVGDLGPDLQPVPVMVSLAALVKLVEDWRAAGVVDYATGSATDRVVKGAKAALDAYGMRGGVR